MLKCQIKNTLFPVPFICHEPTNLFSDCLCLTKISGHSKHTQSIIFYPQSHSMLHHVTQSFESIPVPLFHPLSHQKTHASSAESTVSFLAFESLVTACNEESKRFKQFGERLESTSFLLQDWNNGTSYKRELNVLISS